MRAPPIERDARPTRDRSGARPARVGGPRPPNGQTPEPRFAVPLRLIYLCGLRLSECLPVEVRDIHRQEQRLHIREGKGGKD